MASQIKYLVFKGIEKKEQILFKSFLNLSKNELAYQVIILKDKDADKEPDILIMDEHFELADSELNGKSLATIVVGTNINEVKNSYIARPVQWSDFKTALSQLDLDQVVEEGERVLPDDVKFAIPSVEEPTEDVLEPITPEATKAAEAGFSEEISFEYELDDVSVNEQIDANDGDIDKAVDDVQQFNDADDEFPAPTEPLIMFTDDESASVNSVLVIETNSLDAWDFSESEMSPELESDASEKTAAEDVDQDTEDEVVLERKAGFELAEGEEYWREDNEIIVDHETILYTKPERDLVYSIYEPGKWLKLLQPKSLSRLPLATDWRPKHDLTGYPITTLVWVNTLLNSTHELLDGLDPEQEYMLERWPNFDLIQLDNTLLRLCTMLFVRGETAKTLSQKSGYSLSTVYGLLNACNQSGLVKKAADVQLEQLAAMGAEGSMIGKIKDVFR